MQIICGLCSAELMLGLRHPTWSPGTETKNTFGRIHLVQTYYHAINNKMLSFLQKGLLFHPWNMFFWCNLCSKNCTSLYM